MESNDVVEFISVSESVVVFLFYKLCGRIYLCLWIGCFLYYKIPVEAHVLKKQKQKKQHFIQ